MWFLGNIQEAINRSKCEKKVFMVYIEGDNEASKQMNQFYDESIREDIVNILKNEMVSIRIKQNNRDYENFVQIYPVVVIPCTYFIGNNGVPLEIAGGQMSNEEFIEKITKALKLHKSSLLISQAGSGNNEIQSVDKSDAVSNIIPKEENSKEKEKMQNVNEDHEQKLGRAQDLLEALRVKKAKEEEDKMKNAEKERIRIGKELAKSKKLKEELEMAEIMKEREKDKHEEKLARERVLAQIAADREERRQREIMTKPQSIPKPSPAQFNPIKTVSSSENKSARIQFRLPNCTPLNHEFSPDAKLTTLRDYVVSNSNWSRFTLSTTFPRRTFESKDYNMNLKELDLFPSAVLIVAPQKGASSSGPLISSGILTMIWNLLLSPFYFIWSLVSSIFFPQPKPKDDPKPANSSSIRQERRDFYREGNTVRFRNVPKNGDDEDDDKTYNGNSTQQM